MSDSLLAPLDRVQTLIRVRQIREFTDESVTSAELEAITEVARWSGSSRNEQPCRFVAIRDTRTIARIAELGLPQTRGLATARAAVAVVIPDDPERELSRAFDIGRAVERILIAATELGLGAGVSTPRPEVRGSIGEVLGLPAGWSARAVVAIGHPSDAARQPKSAPGTARLPRDEAIFDERWPPDR
jgi:nitroreductase